MSHTKGPWTIEHYDEQGELYEDGVRIDSPEGPVAFNVIEYSSHLIAAAPELLECLYELACHFAPKAAAAPADEWRGHAAVLRKAVMVIAKAQGRGE